MEHDTPVRSRRAVLGAALGGAAAAAATAIAAPASVLATQGQPVIAGQTNTSTSPTTFQNTETPENTLQAVHSGSAIAFYSETLTGAGVMTRTLENVPSNMGTRSTALWAAVGNTANVAGDTRETGVYGFADTSGSAKGVWGDTAQGIGVMATGDWGLYAFGAATSVLGDAPTSGVGVYGFTGPIEPPPPPAGVAVYARAESTAQTALQVRGKVKFNRSGRVSIGSTSTSKSITMSGVTSSSYVIATLQTSVSGVYVRAVVPTSGSFRIYLNKAPGKTVYVGYLVIN